MARQLEWKVYMQKAKIFRGSDCCIQNFVILPPPYPPYPSCSVCTGHRRPGWGGGGKLRMIGNPRVHILICLLLRRLNSANYTWISFSMNICLFISLQVSEFYIQERVKKCMLYVTLGVWFVIFVCLGLIMSDLLSPHFMLRNVESQLHCLGAFKSSRFSIQTEEDVMEGSTRNPTSSMQVGALINLT